MGLKEDLFQHLNSSLTLPFLFVGTGISIRYLDLVSWENLLRRFADATASPYEYFRSSADGNFPKIASLIADEFHKTWWNSSNFAESRDRFRSATIDKESALKIEVAKYIKEIPLDPLRTRELQQELLLLDEVVVDGIITTNWDLFLETHFPSYKTFVGQNALLFSNPQGIGEIYKIHGSCEEPNSLVLTANDYAKFNERNPYLAAKLMTFFVEHPVIFIGYSLQDENIVSILDSIAACLTQDKIDSLRDQLIFVDWKPDVLEGEMTHSNIRVLNTIIPVITITTDSFAPIYEALGALNRRFSAKMLRQLKEQVYDLVQSNELKEEMKVINIEDDTNSETLEVVFGVGALSQLGLRGLQGLKREDIFNDLIEDSDEFKLVASDVVRLTLPELVVGNAMVPIFKYLRYAGMLDQQGNVVPGDLSTRVVKASKKNINDFRTANFGKVRRQEVLGEVSGIAEMSTRYGPEEVIRYGAFLPEALIDVEELSTFLQANKRFMFDNNGSYAGNYKKLVCIFDCLKYKKVAAAV